ncbi:GGDEF domain-containing protein [Aureimonas sp. SK2]|uniref:GGDEF domain-containing protein n=1 Tax=Aureimonas sp. SK2 TaxID=3015992 RepID=UPI0024443545|nr:GGDEF domain-containing protein [Aureimonas sp. SK2]
MQVDLFTIYVLCGAVLCVASALAFGESLFNERRKGVLRVWALAYLLLFFGTVLVSWRESIPAILGSGLSNLCLFAGYGLMVSGISKIGGRSVAPPALPVVGGALLWLWVGPNLPLPIWHAMASLVIATIQFAGITALLAPSLAPLRSRPLAIAIFAIHGALYMSRVIAMPMLDSQADAAFIQLFALITMGEGVLYAVAAPIALLAMVREEGENRLLAASQTDFLTGLANRRSFTRQVNAATEAGAPAGIMLLCDLDHFKAVNDTYGHQTGDEVLRLFARVAESEMKSAAIIGRLGGEEFAAFIPACDMREGHNMADRLRQRFHQAAAAAKNGPTTVTVSIGVASSMERSYEATMAAADRALYLAKRLGRNRVEQETALAA